MSVFAEARLTIFKSICAYTQLRKAHARIFPAGLAYGFFGAALYKGAAEKYATK